jgi:hypothetical protein
LADSDQQHAGALGGPGTEPKDALVQQYSKDGWTCGVQSTDEGDGGSGAELIRYEPRLYDSPRIGIAYCEEPLSSAHDVLAGVECRMHHPHLHYRHAES